MRITNPDSPVAKARFIGHNYQYHEDLAKAFYQLDLLAQDFPDRVKCDLLIAMLEGIADGEN